MSLRSFGLLRLRQIFQVFEVGAVGAEDYGAVPVDGLLVGFEGFEEGVELGVLGVGLGVNLDGLRIGLALDLLSRAAARFLSEIIRSKTFSRTSFT